MPLLIGLLIVVGSVYQLFFRYEHWPSPDREGVFYEHDNLTGDTHPMPPGAQTSVFARILGPDAGKNLAGKPFGLTWERITGEAERYSNPLFERIDPDEVSLRPVQFEEGHGGLSSVDLRDPKAIAKVARPIPVPKEVVVASNAPPVPISLLAADLDEVNEAGSPFAIRQIDLNQDGAAEEIIQNAVESDGLLDISIVKGGQEIFFGRGTQISLMPSHSNEGWTDIALKTGKKSIRAFRYNPSARGYLPLKTQ